MKFTKLKYEIRLLLTWLTQDLVGNDLSEELVYWDENFGVEKTKVEAWVWKTRVEMFFNHKFPFILGEKQLSNSYCQEQNILQRANFAKSSLHFSWL